RSPADRDKLLAATRRWAAAVPGATASRVGDIVELRSCDPGTAASAPAPPQPPAFEVLSLRADLVDSLRRDSHMPEPVAECTADQIISHVGPATLIGINDRGRFATNDPRSTQFARAASR